MNNEMKKNFIPLGEIKTQPQDRLDIAAIRKRLQGRKGRDYWRSLEELADTPEFKNFVEKEFPASAFEESGKVSRRNFLRLMGASLAMAGLTACIERPRPVDALVPYVRQPEAVIPGRSIYFASTLTLNGYARGVLVESYTGRPIKIEGNPEHPASLGATDAFMQADVLGLYDPDRSQVVKHQGEDDLWERFYTDLAAAGQDFEQGTRVRFLTETITSPSLAAQLGELLERFPNGQWHVYDPVGFDNVRAGAELAFGEPVNTVYNFAEADVILSLDADFLGKGPAQLRYTRDFTDRRRVAVQEVADEDLTMSRLYVVESTLTITGTSADHHYTVRPSQIDGFARALARELGVEAGEGAELPEALSEWIGPLASDLQEHAGRSIVIAGSEQPPHIHALAHAMNDALGNVGATVIYTDPVEANPANGFESLRALAEDIRAGNVDALIILGGNPAYTAPVDLEFGDALVQVPLSVHLGLYEDETAVLSTWHVPMTHELEAWGDARAFDGTISIMQPLIAPLYGGRSPHEILAILAGDAESSNFDLVQGYWLERLDEAAWRRAVHDGFIEGTALEPREVSLQALEVPAAAPAGGFEVVFRPDPSIWDGRYANNPWLQELPKPLTKLVWDNAALIGPATAEALGVTTGDVLALGDGERAIEAAAFVLPGQPADTITLHLGYGRTQTGRIGMDTGFNAYALRTSDAPWFASGLEVSPTGGRYLLVTTQDHNRIRVGRTPEEMRESGEKADDRHLVRHGTLAQYIDHPEFVYELGHTPAGSIYPGFVYTGYAWGMTVDLNTCTGCNACVLACQSENNIPTVGKDEVRRGREMHWIRIDRYFSGDMDHPHVYHQPMLCQHCENAPCEPVCPVAATVHSSEGLNDMAYNRCVGTRYCQNNCPYKVRRFNFFHYSRLEENVLDLVRNPNVTVRSRGVMEKCTFCVQRINRARIDAENEERRIRDGEIVPACAAACPARAIVFGDINDSGSEVLGLKRTQLNYALLEDLNTWPRLTYLARLGNPNAELDAHPEQHAERA
jgi:MoCo/4Fe-4S cofactor protein with predicted Tat translocation signal